MIDSIFSPVLESIFRPVYDSRYVFSMRFTPGNIPTGLVTSISGTRYDYLTEEDEIAGIETAFPANIPTITWRGLRACTAYTNYFLNSKTPVTQTITFAAAGTYTCYHYGTGSVTVSGASTGNGATVGTGAGTRSSAVTFTTASAGMTVTFTVAGSVNRVSVNTGATAMPFIPTGGTAVASVNEIGGYSVTNPKAYTAFNTVSGQFSLPLKVLASPASGGLTLAGPVKLVRHGLIEAIGGGSVATGTWVDAPVDITLKLLWKDGKTSFSGGFKSQYPGTWGLTSFPLLAGSITEQTLVYLGSMTISDCKEAPSELIGMFGTFRAEAGATESIKLIGSTYKCNDVEVISGTSYVFTVSNNKKAKVEPFACITLEMGLSDIVITTGQLSAWRPTGTVYFHSTGITGDIGQLSAWRPTGTVSFASTGITGDIGQLSAWRPTGAVYFYSTGITGDIGQLSAWRPTLSAYFNSTGITGDIGQLSAWRPTGTVSFASTGVQQCSSQNVFPTSKDLRFDGCAINQTGIDNLLISAVNGGLTGGSIQLQGGTNAAPSTTGLSAKATLVSRGWTVTHN